jgi:ABC-type sugar transport system ATPase subunit
LVTESRRDDGLFLDASVEDNLRIVHGARASAGDLIRQLRIVCADETKQPISQLSGGNQQKAVIAKWLPVPPKLLILDEPTRGIDIGAKQEIYELLGNLARDGMALLVISSEAEELLGLCDRILVMAHGEIRQTLSGKSSSREDIMRAAV